MKDDLITLREMGRIKNIQPSNLCGLRKTCPNFPHQYIVGGRPFYSLAEVSAWVRPPLKKRGRPQKNG